MLTAVLGRDASAPRQQHPRRALAAARNKVVAEAYPESDVHATTGVARRQHPDCAAAGQHTDILACAEGERQGEGLDQAPCVGRPRRVWCLAAQGLCARARMLLGKRLRGTAAGASILRARVLHDPRSNLLAVHHPSFAYALVHARTSQ
jgi:hypothetical protein